MDDMKTFLKEMISVSGLSGYESPIRKIIEKKWQPLTDSLTKSKLGSLHGLKQGINPGKNSIMISTHMDAIGLIVTGVKDGFIHVTSIGGVDPRVLPGQLVKVHGREDLDGVVVMPPAHCLPEDLKSGVIPTERLLVDIGYKPKDVEKLVRTGDIFSYNTEPIEFEGNYITGHSLDNRASIMAVTQTLEQLQKINHSWDVYAVASSQEEVTLGGALTSGTQIKPTFAVVVDVTFAKGPGTGAPKAFDFDKGPSFDWGPNTHHKLYNFIKDLASENDIPHQLGVYPRYSGTDANLLQLAGEGIPVMVISIPLRYMHTPVEMVQIKDIKRTSRLLTQLITDLEDNFMEEHMQWDELKSEDKE